MGFFQVRYRACMCASQLLRRNKADCATRMQDLRKQTASPLCSAASRAQGYASSSELHCKTDLKCVPAAYFCCANVGASLVSVCCCPLASRAWLGDSLLSGSWHTCRLADLRVCGYAFIIVFNISCREFPASTICV